jgi:membrane protein DedA with SNARE-associated domain
MDFLHFLTEKISQLGYLGIVIAMFLEGASIPFPGVIIIVLASYWVSRGILNFYLTVLLLGSSYAAGSLIPYFLGRKYQEGIYRTLHKAIKIPIHLMKKIESAFQKYGEVSVLFLRPFGIGSYVSYFAGMSQMELKKFIPYTFIGKTLWGTVIIVVGKNIFNFWENLYFYLSNHLFAIALLLIFLLIAGAFLYKKGKIIFWHTEKR